MKIVAIGGGVVGAGETLSIDRELVSLAARSDPRVLFIPTASDDSPEYYEQVAFTYRRLGCELDALWLWGEDASNEAAARKIGRADAIYVGGGNTKKMIARWRELGVDSMLATHLDAGRPVGGVSAGAICWFKVANSDWPQYEEIEGVNTARLDCLGFVDLAICPHTAREGFRLAEFTQMLRGVPGPGIGLDDCCAIQIEGDRYRILASLTGAVAHRIEWFDGKVHHDEIQPHDDFRPLAHLRDLRMFDTNKGPTT